MMPSSINGCRPKGVFKVFRGSVAWRGRPLTANFHIFLHIAPTPPRAVVRTLDTPYQSGDHVIRELHLISIVIVCDKDVK